MTKHASKSPSQLPRIFLCPASYLATKSMPEEQSPAAAEGEVLHKLIWSKLVGGPTELIEMEKEYSSDESFISAIEVAKQAGVLETKFSEEQEQTVSDALEWYTDNILNPILERDPHAEVWYEKKVSLKNYGPEFDDTHGTSDIIIRSLKFKKLVIADWKFGGGVQVFADNNDQLMSYSGGAIETPEAMFHYNNIDQVIIQPRLGHYQISTITPITLYEWVMFRASPRLQIANTPGSPFVPGVKQCQFCKMRLECRARFEFAQILMKQAFAGFQINNSVSAEELEDLYDKSKDVKKFLSDIEKELTRRLLTGEPVNRFKLVEGKSIRRWKDEQQAAEFLMNHLDIEDIFESKLASAPKAEKKLPLKVRRSDEFQALIEKPDGAPTIVSIFDGRAPISGRNVIEAFKDFMED